MHNYRHRFIAYGLVLTLASAVGTALFIGTWNTCEFLLTREVERASQCTERGTTTPADLAPFISWRLTSCPSSVIEPVQNQRPNLGHPAKLLAEIWSERSIFAGIGVLQAFTAVATGCLGSLLAFSLSPRWRRFRCEMPPGFSMSRLRIGLLAACAALLSQGLFAAVLWWVLAPRDLERWAFLNNFEVGRQVVKAWLASTGTVAFSLGVLFSIRSAPALRAIARRCRRCAYPRSRSRSHCPECGQPHRPADHTGRSAVLSRRWTLVAASTLALSVCSAAVVAGSRPSFRAWILMRPFERTAENSAPMDRSEQRIFAFAGEIVRLTWDDGTLLLLAEPATRTINGATKAGVDFHFKWLGLESGTDATLENAESRFAEADGTLPQWLGIESHGRSVEVMYQSGPGNARMFRTRNVIACARLHADSTDNRTPLTMTGR